jgi:hypothetical protein
MKKETTTINIKYKRHIVVLFEKSKIVLIDNLRLRVNYIHLCAHRLKVNFFGFTKKNEKKNINCQFSFTKHNQYFFHLNDVLNSCSLRRNCSSTFFLSLYISSDDSIIGVEKLITFCSSIVFGHAFIYELFRYVFNEMIRNGRLSTKDKIKSSLTSSFFSFTYADCL